MTVCHDSAQLAAALPTLEAADGWFAEPFTTGIPVTCGILEIDGSPIALPPLETLPTDAEFYDYATKRDKTKYRYRCPAELPSPTLDALTTAALTAHCALACTGYSRSDFIVTPDGSPLWLEINTLPGLSHTGNLATMAAAADIDYDQLIRLILAIATTNEGYRAVTELTARDVQDAAANLEPVATRTPALTALSLDQAAFRGAYHHVSSLPVTERARGLIGASSGNHAQALALVGRLLEVPATVVIPADAPDTEGRRHPRAGGRVVTYRRDCDDRDALVAEIAACDGLAIVPRRTPGTSWPAP